MRMRESKSPDFLETAIHAARLALDAEKAMLGIKLSHRDQKRALVRAEIDLDGQAERQPLR
jgi:hypothetical protein